MKKIGIITLPLSYNIGGILQAYALSQLCKSIGYTPYIITRRKSRHKLLQFLVFLKWSSIIWISRIVKVFSIPWLQSLPLIATQSFKNRHLASCNQIFFSEKSIYNWSCRLNIKTFVCGSDQIWNPGAWPSIKFAFAQFNSSSLLKRYAFAPSLGHSANNYSPCQAVEISEYLDTFEMLSCREKAGLQLLSKITKNKVSHILDPTFLIDKDHYSVLTRESTFSPDYNFMFIYLLDISREQCEMISNLCRKYKLVPVTFYPLNYKTICKRNAKLLTDYGIRVLKIPSPENWIKAIKCADFVFTDSFHGTVFSLIFNTPFLSLVNSKRGSARFLNLQELFDIHHLFIDQFDDISQFTQIPTSIDWENINSRIHDMVNTSFSYLRSFDA